KGAKRKLCKAYILLITCATSRAVHLELVTGLTTRLFLSAFRRFVSGRGLPQLIISDNALTFVRASKDLAHLWNAISDQATREYYSQHKIMWKFNVPRAPWWGGFFERLVRNVKDALRAHLS